VTTVEDAPTTSPAAGVEPLASEPRRRRRLVWPAVGVCLAAAAGVGVWRWTSGGSTGSSPATTGPIATAVVELGTISATENWQGRLDHGTPFTVNYSADGTVTRLVDQGVTVERGDELYRVDERPVILLYGDIPMFRNLGRGDSGADVAQLEANLAEMGYGNGAVDDTYTGSTAAAVRAWQTDIGTEPTGTVARGDAVFVSETGRVDTLHVDIGDVVGPGTPVLDLTGTDEVVSLQADVDDRDRLDIGAPATVVLPDGGEVAGTVDKATVVEVAPEPEGGNLDGGSEPETEMVVQVQIALAEDVADELAGAPVEVVVAIDERADVLLVPVTALLALSEGGYGLEVVGDDGITEIVPVDTGLFADGKVQVEGEGVAEGTVVGIAGR